MEYKSTAVMAYILYQCKLNHHPINKTQCHKLLYCCYGIIMAKFDERLTNEHPRCWPYGPIFPCICVPMEKGQLTVGLAQDFAATCPPDVMHYLDLTIRTFWSYTADALSKWSRLRNSPWDKAESLGPLDDREIRLFFQGYIAIVEDRGTCQKQSQEASHGI